jgi:hypothetical protein
MSLSKAQMLYEIGKSLKDPIYAIESYLETEDRTQGGFVPFKLFPRQKELVRAYESHEHNIVMKPRQAGISTTTAAYLAILTALSSNKSTQKILIAANKQETAKEFLKKIRDFTVQLPSWMDVYRGPNSDSWFDPEKNSSSHYKLWNGSEVKAVASSKDALRGYTPSVIVVDEAAFIEGNKGEEFYTAAQPSLSTGGRSILISTPNGHDPLYHKAYTTAERGKNNFNIVSMKWYEDPRYNGRNDGSGMSWLLHDEKTGDVVEEIVDPKSGQGEESKVPESTWVEMIKKGYTPRSKWFDDMCAQLNHNARSIAQELLCSFVGSGDNVIDDKYKNRQERDNVKDPIRKEWVDGNMWIWEDPIQGHQYILAADPSSGSSDDFAGLCIWDFTTGNQVAEYHGKVAPDVLGEICKYYGESYDAFIVVDITGGWGASVVLKLIELGYPKKRLYYDITVGIDSVENNKALQKYMDKGKLPGLNFQKNRNTIVSKLEEAIRMDSFKIRSKRALMEIETFVFIGGRADHMKGYHDDLLMSIAMCCFVGATSFKDLEKSKGQAKAMVSSWSVETNNVEDDSTLNEVINTGFYTDNKNRKKDKQTLKETQEYMWLFGGMTGFKKR